MASAAAVHVATTADTLIITVEGGATTFTFSPSLSRTDGPLLRLRRQLEALGGHIVERPDAASCLTITLPPAR